MNKIFCFLISVALGYFLCKHLSGDGFSIGGCCVDVGDGSNYVWHTCKTAISHAVEQFGKKVGERIGKGAACKKRCDTIAEGVRAGKTKKKADPAPWRNNYCKCDASICR